MLIKNQNIRTRGEFYLWVSKKIYIPNM